MTKHYAAVQSRQRRTFACPGCGGLTLDDLGSHAVAFQFDLTGVDSAQPFVPRYPASQRGARRQVERAAPAGARR